VTRISDTAGMIFMPTGSIVVRGRPDAAKVAHFRQMLRDGSKPPPIKIMKCPMHQMVSTAADGTAVLSRWRPWPCSRISASMA
jgi:hypothetical protein